LIAETDKMTEPNHETAEERPAPRLKFGRYSVPLPRSRTARIATGAALMVGGTFSFLPVLGLWMLPAGALVLSADSAAIRRLRRRTEVWWGRRGTREK
jgi:uncharacterized protein (DUF2062 family)